MGVLKEGRVAVPVRDLKDVFRRQRHGLPGYSFSARGTSQPISQFQKFYWVRTSMQGDDADSGSRAFRER